MVLSPVVLLRGRGLTAYPSSDWRWSDLWLLHYLSYLCGGCSEAVTTKLLVGSCCSFPIRCRRCKGLLRALLGERGSVRGRAGNSSGMGSVSLLGFVLEACVSAAPPQRWQLSLPLCLQQCTPGCRGDLCQHAQPVFLPKTCPSARSFCRVCAAHSLAGDFGSTEEKLEAFHLTQRAFHPLTGSSCCFQWEVGEAFPWTTQKGSWV